MGDPTTVRLDADHQNALDEMIDEGHADNQSEALRQTSRSQLVQEGYFTGSGESYWTLLLRRVGYAFMYAGVGVVAVFYFLPAPFRITAVAPLISGLVCLGASRAIEEYQTEPTNHTGHTAQAD
jgi:hypothetical protein